jgi:hypothetical protein
MACWRLLTLPPLPPLPDFRVPCCFLRIALSTDFPAALPYLRPLDFFPERFLAGIFYLLGWLVEPNAGKGCRNALRYLPPREKVSELNASPNSAERDIHELSQPRKLIEPSMPLDEVVTVDDGEESER